MNENGPKVVRSAPEFAYNGEDNPYEEGQVTNSQTVEPRNHAGFLCEDGTDLSGHGIKRDGSFDSNVQVNRTAADKSANELLKQAGFDSYGNPI